MRRADTFLEQINKKLSKEFKIAYVSAFIFGMIAHLYMFTNKLPNYDDMALNGFGATFRLGRWFLWVLGSVAYHLDYVYSLPLVNGLISMVFLAISAGIIVDLLKIKSIISTILIAGILVVFPSWTGTFFFMFTAPYYALAVFLMVVSAYFLRKYKYGYVISAFCITLATGIYQAYLPFIATLYVVLLIQDLYNQETKWEQTLKNAVKYLVTLIVGVCIYYVLMRISLVITNQQLADYKGTGQMGNISLSLVPQMISRMFTDGLGVVINNNLEVSYNLLLKVGYAVLFFTDFIIIVISCRYFAKKKELGKVGMLLLLSMAFFIAINSIFIMCPSDDAVYVLMTYSYSFFVILPICLIDKLFTKEELNEKKTVIAMEYGIVGVVFAMIITYCHFANAQYLSMQLSFKQAKGFYTTLITQIKSVEGYSDDLPVAIVEGSSIIDDKTLYRNEVMDVFDLSGRDEVLAETYSREYMLAYYCGFKPEYMNADDLPKEIIDVMPTYPMDGSIQIIDNVVVVKLSE